MSASLLESPTALVVFTFSYFNTFAELLLDEFANSPPTNDEVTRGWVSALAERTNTIVLFAPTLGIDREQARAGLQIAQSLQALSQQENFSSEELADVAAEFKRWSRSVGNESSYALRGLPTPSPTPTVANQVGTNIQIALPQGDAVRGEELHEASGCSACHLADPSIPASGPSYGASDYEYSQNQMLIERAQATWQSESYTGKAVSTEQYLLESIVLPAASIVTGYQSFIHPQTYGQSLSKQDAADLIAYLKTFD